MRAVSTVLDVTVFLLCVSAAVAALAVPAVEEPTAGADGTADALARTTANVSFRVGAADGRATGPERRVSGTHAGLLGRAALANLRLDGRGLAPASGGFREAVENETARALAWSPERTSVTAVWEPYAGAPLSGRVHVGAKPPPGIDVATASLRVPVPVSDCRVEARSAADDGYEAVAGVLAGCLVDATLPRNAVATPDPSSSAGRASRLRLGSYESGLSLDGEGSSFEARRARIESALAGRLAADMRGRFESPAAAAGAVRTGTARIVVREWEP